MAASPAITGALPGDFPIRALAGQVLVAGFSGEGLPPELEAAARRSELGGIILFKRNVASLAQVAALCGQIARACPPHLPPLVAIDQEGGRVARLGPPVLRLPPMRRLGDLDDPALTRRAGAVLGRQLAALGITMDFAPVLDVDTNPENPVIGDRAFGSDPETVIRHGLAFAGGLMDAGVLACGKHFPGHGDTDEDSHLALPRLAHDRARLDAVELAPFRAARGQLPTLMTAHVVFEALDPSVPATLSRRVIGGLLREELGYDGVVISDDLEMKAVLDTFGVAESACRAIEAGCDTLLVCSRLELVREAHESLTRRAERDPVFAARLRDAAARSIACRARAAPAPLAAGESLEGRLRAPEVAALEEELARRLGR